jgi:hypothetical protein
MRQRFLFFNNQIIERIDADLLDQEFYSCFMATVAFSMTVEYS